MTKKRTWCWMTWYRNLGTSVGGFEGSRRWAKYDHTTLSEIFNKLIKIFAANRNFWYSIQKTILKETVSFTTVQIPQWCIKESCNRWIEVVNHCIKEIIYFNNICSQWERLPNYFENVCRGREHGRDSVWGKEIQFFLLPLNKKN